jgi:hypothetical protein
VQIFVEKTQSKLVLKNGHNQVIFLELWLRSENNYLDLELTRGYDFDSQTSSLEEVSRKIFSAHFGQLAVIFLWISGMHFHGAYFSNYSAWLNDQLILNKVLKLFGQSLVKKF